MHKNIGGGSVGGWCVSKCDFLGLTVQLFANLGLKMPLSEECLCVSASSSLDFMVCLVDIVCL